MNINKKLDRMKQWAGERMGGEVRTDTSEDFRALEVEMGLRHEGMEKMQKSMKAYVQAISKRTEAQGKEKNQNLPIAYLGSTMVAHGEDFDGDSEFGQCLSTFGRTQERLARSQESYIMDATNSWLESLERSMVQMKEYQAARKKLETRRLAYDTSLAKMQKAKKEDFRVEEELRSQKAKYEESEDEVYRRMQDIKEAETESVTDLSTFLDAELSYHDKCREALMQLRQDWPAGDRMNVRAPRANARSRSNTARSYLDRTEKKVEEPAPEPRPSIKSNHAASYRATESPVRDYEERSQPRPTYGRSTTFEGPSQIRRDISPMGMQRLARLPSDSLAIRTTKSQLRTVDQTVPEHDVFQDDSPFYSNSSPDSNAYGARSVSPATSQGSGGATPLKKGPPPPPPPSRALKKPPPPPPPSKRSLLT